MAINDLYYRGGVSDAVNSDGLDKEYYAELITESYVDDEIDEDEMTVLLETLYGIQDGEYYSEGAFKKYAQAIDDKILSERRKEKEHIKNGNIDAALRCRENAKRLESKFNQSVRRFSDYPTIDQYLKKSSKPDDDELRKLRNMKKEFTNKTKGLSKSASGVSSHHGETLMSIHKMAHDSKRKLLDDLENRPDKVTADRINDVINDAKNSTRRTLNYIHSHKNRKK